AAPARRPPLPEQQDQREAARQHVGAALDRLRHDPRPHPLEARPRHDAVLHGEEREQPQVDEHRRAERPDRRRVEALRHHEIADEAGSIEEGGEEDGVRDDAVDERDDSSHDPWSPFRNTTRVTHLELSFSRVLLFALVMSAHRSYWCGAAPASYSCRYFSGSGPLPAVRPRDAQHGSGGETNWTR